MTDRDIRAYLRGAVQVGRIGGWQANGFLGIGDGYRFHIMPEWPTPAPPSYTPSEAAEFCEMLKADGVAPLFRASEPTWLGGKQ